MSAQTYNDQQFLGISMSAQSYKDAHCKFTKKYELPAVYIKFYSI